MKTIKHLFIAILFLSALESCEKVDIPLPKPEVLIDTSIIKDSIPFPVVDSSAMNREYRKTFVEEFTGHSCVTCPANTELLLAQYASNKERMIISAVHAGQFAKVSDDYPTDFQTNYGDRIFEYFLAETTPIPSALINRRVFPNFKDLMIFNQATTFWDGPINYENSNSSADFAIGLAADLIDSLDIFFITVSTEVLNQVSGNYRLLTLCIEDSVVAEQSDIRVSESEHPKKIVKNYMHRHVLRGKLNPDLSIHGDVLFSGSKAPGEWLHYELNAALPERIVNKENLLVVALIINVDTEEIMQSEEVHVHIK